MLPAFGGPYCAITCFHMSCEQFPVDANPSNVAVKANIMQNPELALETDAGAQFPVGGMKHRMESSVVGTAFLIRVLLTS